MEMKTAVQGLKGEVCLLKGLKSVTGAETRVKMSYSDPQQQASCTTPMRPSYWVTDSCTHKLTFAVR